MFYNNFFYFFLEVYIIGVFFLILFLLTCWKLLKKSIKLNGLVCSVFLIVLFTSICLYNYLFFIENFYFFENEDFFYFFFKNIVLIFLFIFGIASYNYFNYFKEGYVLPDFYLLLLIFLLVNLVLLSVNDIMLFYVLLELQNLIFFIFAAFVRNRWFVVEAAFRYFLVSGFSTMMFLLSFCLFWGVTGILDFSLYLIFFENMENFGFMYYFFWLALIFFFFSFSLKLGLFPFHWWLVDVYEGVPLLIVFFFMIMPKIFLVFFLIKFFYIFFFFNLNTVMFFYFFFVLGSMLWALIKVLYQFSLIRFLVYSSIFNMSFIYVGLFSSTIFGVISTFIFLMVYLFNTLGLFFFFLSVKFKRSEGGFFFIKTLFDLSYFINSYKKSVHYMVFIIVFFFLSIAGVPPLVGFLSKFLILWNYIYSGSFFYFFLILFISILGSVYYLRAIRFFIFSIKTVNAVHVYLKMTSLQEIMISMLVLIQVFGFLFFFDIINFFLLCFYV